MVGGSSVGCQSTSSVRRAGGLIREVNVLRTMRARCLLVEEEITIMGRRKLENPVVLD